MSSSLFKSTWNVWKLLAHKPAGSLGQSCGSPTFGIFVLPHRTKYMSRMRFPMNNPRDQGLTAKSKPYMHGNTNSLDYKVMGVSDKQYPLLLKWERPKHIQRCEQHPQGSGDCEGVPELSMNLPRIEVKDSPAYEEAPEIVKKVFSLEYSRRKDYNNYVREMIKGSVRRHDYDESSLEARIAKITATIRIFQKDLMDNHPHRNASLRHRTKILVDHRRGLLRRLREQDYRKFEWILEKLNLVYRPRPVFWEKIERKKHLRRLTELWCDELQKFRLDKVKNNLKKEQPKYLREKAETLRWIMQEESELGLPATVTEEDIKNCISEAEKIEAELREMEGQLKEEYHIFQPPQEKEGRTFIP